MKPLGAVDFPATQLDRVIELNALRAAGASARRDALERDLAARFDVDRHLAVYGSLAPGRSNAHQLAGLAGAWHAGLFVTGELVHAGWGDDLGYPALRWSPKGSAVDVQLLVSADLPSHWARLDEFEGSEYLRIVVPVHSQDGVVALANLYAVHVAAPY